MPKIDSLPTQNARPKRQRKSSEQRVSDIIEAAADHFAEIGFGGGTREIAKRVGVTQPLLYRYFPDKDSLIEAVYRSVYLESWNADWEAILQDRSQSVRSRFDAFYRAYTQANFTPRWLRISYFAGLRDAHINEWYNHLVEELILKQLVREHRIELGQPDDAYVSPAELEPAWQIHGGLLHYGWRRHVLNLPVTNDMGQVIDDALDMYFAVAANVYAREADSDADTGH
ncbi:TetR/AcrR family transcriptional regulator [Rhodobacteraceae bacterium]|nr:TetR/AcrR family transcriptional regulator [Paracoccaceae bacterium]